MKVVHHEVEINSPLEIWRTDQKRTRKVAKKTTGAENPAELGFLFSAKIERHRGRIRPGRSKENCGQNPDLQFEPKNARWAHETKEKSGKNSRRQNSTGKTLEPIRGHSTPPITAAKLPTNSGLRAQHYPWIKSDYYWRNRDPIGEETDSFTEEDSRPPPPINTAPQRPILHPSTRKFSEKLKAIINFRF